MSDDRREADLSKLSRLAFEQFSDYAVFLLDCAGTICSWGPGVDTVLGQRRDDFVGQPFAMLFPPAEQAAGRPAAILDLARSAGRTRLDGWRTARQGVDFLVRGSVVSLVEHGGVVGFLVTIGDATEAQIRALELSRRVGEFETLLDVLPIGIGIARDAEAKDIRVNRAFGSILRLPPQANASLSAPETERPHHFKVVQDGRELAADELPLQRAAKEARAITEVEVDLVFDTGERKRLLEFASPLFDERGAVRGSVGAFIDVTDRKELEEQREQLLTDERAAREQAERANRIKDEFLAGLSHELRTPLNAILGWSQILRHREQSPEHMHQGLEVIERNARLQTTLIDDLLDMSRILAGQVRLDVQQVQMAGAIDGAIESIRPSADAKGIRLRTVLDPRALVTGDPVRLQQVVWNVLSNAVKFTPRGGRIDVTLERIDSHVELTVSDTGVGISDDFLPYVFDRFRQADGSPSRRFSGLGLGLSIVKHLTELHGGTVRASSAGHNQGATFVIMLPVAALVHESGMTRTAPSITAAATVPTPALSLDGVSVLIVEDDADSRALVAAILEDCGATVRSVGSATEALLAVQQRLVDVVVSDIGLPEHDGYEFVRRLRELDGPASAIPALALTAYARSDDRRRALVAGFQMHVSKPVEPVELCTAVASLARRLGTQPSLPL